MSWRAYETLTMQPDFTHPPEMGLGEGGLSLVEFGQAPAWGAWHGDTDLALAFVWRFSSAAEQRSIRELMNTLGGRAMPFFLPSWQPDFQLVEPVETGSTSIRIKAAGLSAITENRPDTDGRQIFLAAPDGRFQPFGIVAATLDGSDEVLQLDSPAASAYQPSETMVGKMRLVRLADDRIEYRQERPGHGTVGLRCVTSRQTRRVNENPLVESEAVFGLRPFVDVIATDENPLLASFLTPRAVGPVAYGDSGTHYQTEWTGSVTTGAFRMSNGIGEPITSALFTDGSTQHATFSFDASGKEFVAWVTVARTIRLAYYKGLDAAMVEFPGTSPIAFTTYAIDSTADAGTADAVLFYLRDGFSGIFARFYREDFATERLVCRSPAFPIYLQFAEPVGGKIELIGMDAGHRRCRWRAGDYVPPLEPEIATARVGEVAGFYRSVRVGQTIEDAARAGAVGTVTGNYRSVRVESRGNHGWGGEGRVVGEVTGLYRPVRVSGAAAEPGTAGLVEAVSVGYVLVRKTSEGGDAQSTSIQSVSISYQLES